MKRLSCILIFLAMIVALSSAQENIFGQKDGYIYPKKKFIDSLAVVDMATVKPYIPVANAQATTLKGQNTKYLVKLSKFTGDYPGDFNVIQISQGNKKLLEVTNADGWSSLPSNIPSPNGNFFQVNLTPYSSALFFFSEPKDNYPQDLTILVLRTGRAHLVFNRPCVLQSISKNSYSIQLEMDDCYPVHFAPAGTTSKEQTIAEPQEPVTIEQPTAQSTDTKASKKKKRGKKKKKTVQIPLIPLDSSVVIVKEPEPKPEPVIPKRYLIWSENGYLKIKEQL